MHIRQQDWSDEPVRFQGRRYAFDNVSVFPKPVQAGGMPLWMAAQRTAGAERAARFGLHLLPQGGRTTTIDPWRYTQWAREAGEDVTGFTDPERIPQRWTVGDVEHCVAELAAFIATYGITDIVRWATPPGIRPARMNASLEKSAHLVMPRLPQLHAANT